MVEKDAKLLAEKYSKGLCSPEELAMIESWYAQLKVEAGAPGHEQITSSMIEVWAALNLNARPSVRLWPRIAVAAAAVAAVVVGVYFFSSKYQDASIKTGSIASVNDIAPGKNGATITLDNGQVIALNGAKKGVIVGEELKYSDGSTDPALSRTDISLSEGERSVMVNASTAKGQMYEFTLPDGTHVWLNADSKISFPSQFNGTARKILLSGEAYFEVAKDKAHPFVVESKDQQVEVLGTHFNLNSYDDALSSTVTSLLEGSVKVTGKGGARILKPGERGINTIKGVMLLRGSAEDDVDWKNGDFIFRQESLAEIMRRVSRWYGVDVIYEEDVDQMQTFSGSVSRSKPVSAILGIMQSTGQVKFRIAGKKIYINK